ncbi:hypothetical protein ACQYRI_10160 [Salmonella enterica]
MPSVLPTENELPHYGLHQPLNSERTGAALVENIRSVKISSARFASLQGLPRQVWHFLTNFFGTGEVQPQSKPIEMTEVCHDGHHLRIAAENEALLNGEQQQELTRPSSKYSGLLVAGISLLATAGSLGIYYGRMGEGDDIPERPPGNNSNTTSLTNTEAVALPVLDIHRKMDSEAIIAIKSQQQAGFIKLPNTACFEITKAMDFKDKALAVGNALSNADVEDINATTLDREHCLLPEQVEWVKSVTEPAVMVSKMISAAFPGMNKESISQLLVGPLLVTLAKGIGNNTSQSLMQERLYRQLVYTAEILLPTLTPAEQSLLYQSTEVKNSAPTNIDIGKRFVSINGQFQIKVNNKTYTPALTADSIPYIIDEKNRYQFICYNQRLNQWQFVNHDDIFSGRGRDEIKSHSIKLKPLSLGDKIKINTDYNVFTLTRTDKKTVTGVFVAGEFVPVWWKMSYKGVAYTNNPQSDSARLLVKNDFGWVFEQPSIKMDRYLELLLDDRIGVISRYTQNRISAISKENGLSISNKDQLLLKKDQKYYYVSRKYNSSQKKYDYILPDYSGAIIKYENEVMKLCDAEDAVFAFRSQLVTNEEKAAEAFCIEEQLDSFLRNNVLLSTVKPQNEIHYGLFSDDEGNPVFKVAHDQYVVRQHSERNLWLKKIDHGNDPATDIVLWLYGNTWLKVRDKNDNKPFRYIKLPPVKLAEQKDSPLNQLPVSMESELHAQLQKHIDDETVNNESPNIANLVAFKEFDAPVCFLEKETYKQYFLFNGHYFAAQFVSVGGKDNFTTEPYLKITAKGDFFTRNKFISNIVIEKKGHGVEIKSQETYLAEQININKALAASYIRDFPLKDLRGMSMIEDLVSSAVIEDNAGLLQAPQQLSSKDKYLPPGVLANLLKENIFTDLTYDKYKLKVYSLIPSTILRDDIDSTIRQNIVDAINYVKDEQIAYLINTLKLDAAGWPIIHDYLSGALQNSNIMLTANVMAAIRESLPAMAVILDQNRFSLVKLDDKNLVNKLSSTKNFIFYSAEEGRFYISTDIVAKLENPREELITAIMQAAFATDRLPASFADILHISDMSEPLQDTKERLIDAMLHHKLTSTQEKDLINISKEYIGTIKQYQPQVGMFLRQEKLAWLANNDPVYLAYLFINTPQFSSLLAQDLYYLLSIASTATNTSDQWITHYKKQRAEVMVMTPNHISLAANGGRQIQRRGVLRDPTNRKNLGDAFLPRTHQNTFLPNEDSVWLKANVHGIAKPSVKEVPIDEVRIVRLYDFSCITIRANIGLWDAVWIIGDTIRKPITALGRESQVIHQHNTLGEGCPNEDDVEWLKKILLAVDGVATFIMSLAKRLRFVSYAQSIGGPALMALADHMRDKKVTFEFIDDVHEQVLAMSKDMIFSLSPPERSALYAQPNSKGEMPELIRNSFSTRFSGKDGKGHVKIDGKLSELWHLGNDAPYVVDEHGYSHFIRFNHQQNEWQYIEEKDNLYYSSNNQQEKHKYSRSLIDQPDSFSIAASADNFNEVVVPGRAPLTGVFVGNDFIPAIKFSSTEGLLFCTNNDRIEERRVLIHSDYGWEFEQPDAPMDDYLNLLLRQSNFGSTYLPTRKIYPMHSLSGISVIVNEGGFIKYDNKFYKTKNAFNAEDKTLYRELDEHPGSVINFEDGLFKLKAHRDMLFGLRVRQVKAATIVSEPEVFRIESSTLKYLNENAQTSQSYPVRYLQPRVSADQQGNLFFVVDDKKFQVSGFNDNQIYIKRKTGQDRSDDIIVYNDKDTWFRVRDEGTSEDIKYEALNSCRIARSPGAGANCLTVLIDQKLYNLFTECVKVGLNSEPREENLVLDDTFDAPLLYVDTKTSRKYLSIADSLFDAEIIDADNAENPTGLTCMKITGRHNLAYRHTPIATIAVEIKDGTVEIKSQAVFMAEKLNVDSRVTTLYLRNRPWQPVSGMEEVEVLLNEAKSTGKMHVEMPQQVPSSPRRTVTPQQQMALMTKRFYTVEKSQDPHLQVNIFKIDENLSTRNFHEQMIQHTIKSAIKYTEARLFYQLNTFLYYDLPYWKTIWPYLIETLNSDKNQFLMDFCYSMRKRLQVVDKTLNESKIFLVSADSADGGMVRVEQEPNDDVMFISVQDSNIYINMNRVVMEDNPQNLPATDLYSSLLRIIMRAKGLSVDYVNLPKERGHSLPVMDAISSAIATMRNKDLTAQQRLNLMALSRSYLQKIPAYNKRIDYLLTPEKLSFLFQNDAGYRAHLLLNSDYFISLMSEDIFYQISADQLDSEQRDTWMKNYLERRQIVDLPPVRKGIQPVRSGLTTEVINMNIERMRHFDGEIYLRDAQKVPELSNAIARPKLTDAENAINVAYFLRLKGFGNIRYRGVAIFVHGEDKMPVIHYTVVGDIRGREYVFDLTAGRFAERFENFAGPVILPEIVWAQKYATATDRSLIKYSDYRHYQNLLDHFNPSSEYMAGGPEMNIPDAMILHRPAWYYPDANAPKYIMVGKKLPNLRGYENPVRDAFRRSQLLHITPDTSWEYCMDLLENSELLSQQPCITLREGLQKFINQPGEQKGRGVLTGLFASAQTIEGNYAEEKLLRIRQGDLLLFMQADASSEQKTVRPIHVMISVGNGRFVGLRNNVLEPSLGEDHKVITAEQLGEFKRGRFQLRHNPSQQEVRLIAVRPKELQLPGDENLILLAGHTASRSTTPNAAVTVTLDLLQFSGELAVEQVFALWEVLTPMLKTPASTTITGRPMTTLFSSYKQVFNQALLGEVAKGEVVFFTKPGAQYVLEHFMYSLGEGSFVMINPEQLDERISSRNAIIQSSAFPEDIFKKYEVKAGYLSLSELRRAALLGVDSLFRIDGKVVTVRSHGTDGITAYMNPAELAEVIKGIGLRDKTRVDWSQVDNLVLESCYGAYGRQPVGQSLAKLLNVKVTAWGTAFSEHVRNSEDIKLYTATFEPSEMTQEEIAEMEEQAERNCAFWELLMSRFVYQEQSRRRRDVSTFDQLLDSIEALIKKKITVATFLAELPEYEAQMYVSEETISKITAEQPDEAERFAQIFTDIINLSGYSATLLNRYLS